ncbi:MAG: hypothetical protein MK085_13350 [Phycisphaerales bacterium]|nr:hypothetical protein [Phycisphaerales bacterium]
MQSSLARWIDPEFHQLPDLTNPRAVAFGLQWFAACMAISFITWTLGMVMTQGPFSLEQVQAGSTSLQPGWSRTIIALGGWVLLASPVLGLLAAPSVFMLAPLRRMQDAGKAWRIIVLLAVGLLLWFIAMVLQTWIQPGGGLHQVTRAAAESGRSGQWDTALALATLAPLPGGWVLLFGIRSLLGELGRRSRTFRTATTKRQYVLDLIWATLFWSGGILLQYGGGGLGVTMPVTVGTILRLVAGGFVLVGVVYLWVNLRWIGRPRAVPPPRLRSLLAPDPNAVAGSASSAGSTPLDSDH